MLGTVLVIQSTNSRCGAMSGTVLVIQPTNSRGGAMSGTVLVIQSTNSRGGAMSGTVCNSVYLQLRWWQCRNAIGSAYVQLVRRKCRVASL